MAQGVCWNRLYLGFVLVLISIIGVWMVWPVLLSDACGSSWDLVHGKSRYDLFVGRWQVKAALLTWFLVLVGCSLVAATISSRPKCFRSIQFVPRLQNMHQYQFCFVNDYGTLALFLISLRFKLSSKLFRLIRSLLKTY